MILEGVRAKRGTEMADQGPAQPRALDWTGLHEALKLLAAQHSPIHSAISAIYNQSKSQATPYNYRLPE